MRTTAFASAAVLALVPATAALAQLAYRPDTCAPGFVWREAFAGDRVCVTPTPARRQRRTTGRRRRASSRAGDPTARDNACPAMSGARQGPTIWSV